MNLFHYCRERADVQAVDFEWDFFGPPKECLNFSQLYD